MALCLIGRHSGEGRFDVDAFRTSVTHVSGVLDADIFATPGPFDADLQAELRRYAGSNKFFFDAKKYVSFEQLVSVLAMNATRWPWAFRAVGRHCGSVLDVDKVH